MLKQSSSLNWIYVTYLRIQMGRVIYNKIGSVRGQIAWLLGQVVFSDHIMSFKLLLMYGLLALPVALAAATASSPAKPMVMTRRSVAKSINAKAGLTVRKFIENHLRRITAWQYAWTVKAGLGCPPTCKYKLNIICIFTDYLCFRLLVELHYSG